MSLFFTALVVGYSGAVMPGPLLTYDIEQSLSSGWRRGLLVPVGHVMAEVCLLVLIVSGFGRFLNQPAAQTALFLIGGLILLWFGFDMIKGAVINRQPDEGVLKKDNHPSTPWKVIAKSGILTAANPYFLLWWATIGLGFIMGSGSLSLGSVLIFYLGHALADFSWYIAVALLCDKMSGFFRGMAYRIMISGLGLLLVFYAARFIINGQRLVTNS
jgi:threonine/homoserine/homoserine lactone efflux protein